MSIDDIMLGKCGNTWRTASFPQGAETNIFFHFHDSQGVNLDLSRDDLINSGELEDTNCGHSVSISYPSSCSGFSDSVNSLHFIPDECLEVRLAMYDRIDGIPLFDVKGEIVDPATGYVKFPLTKDQTIFSGSYLGQIGLFQNQRLIRYNTVILDCMPTYWGSQDFARVCTQRNEPLTISEVRLALRDYCPDQNLLIRSYEFSDTEILYALRRPVDYWNETRPPTQVFQWQLFPYRSHHIEGALSELLRMATFRFMRNDLPYSEGGISVNDQSKGPAYQAMAKELWQKFAAWVKTEKVAQNIQNGFGAMNSPYSWRW